MIRIASEKELLESFRPLDREEVLEFPANLKFPFLLKDYLTWTEPSGHRIYLVFNEQDTRRPLGIVFKRGQGAGTAPPQMCEWCHSVRAGDGVGLLTATASSSRRVGLHLCRDLSCKDKVESTPGANDFFESMSSRERIQRIVGRMTEFARRQLF